MSVLIIARQKCMLAALCADLWLSHVEYALCIPLLLEKNAMHALLRLEKNGQTDDVRPLHYAYS